MSIRCFILFLEFINAVSILLHNFIEFIILLYIFLVISFAWYKEYINFLILHSKFSDILRAFTCVRTIGNLSSVCLKVNILRLEWSEILSEKPVSSVFLENILLSKALRTLSLTSKSSYKFLRTSSFFCFFSEFFGFICFLKLNILTNKSIWYLLVSFRITVTL